MTKIPSTHTSVTIDLTEYGYEGRIVMSSPNVLQLTALQNTIFSYILTDDEIREMESLEAYQRATFLNRIQVRKYPTVLLLTILSTITEAPFHLNDYAVSMELDVKSFTTYIADKRNLYNRMLTEMSKIEDADPLF